MDNEKAGPYWEREEYFYTTLWQFYSTAKLCSSLVYYKENCRPSTEEHLVLYRRKCIISLKRETEELANLMLLEKMNMVAKQKSSLDIESIIFHPWRHLSNLVWEIFNSKHKKTALHLPLNLHCLCTNKMSKRLFVCLSRCYSII